MESFSSKVTANYFKKNKLDLDSIYFNVTSVILFINLKLSESIDSKEWKKISDIFFNKFDFKKLKEHVDKNIDWDFYFKGKHSDILSKSFINYVKAIKCYFNIKSFLYFNSNSFNLDDYHNDVNLFSQYLEKINNFIEGIKVVFPRNFCDISIFIKNIRKGERYGRK